MAARNETIDDPTSLTDEELSLWNVCGELVACPDNADPVVREVQEAMRTDRHWTALTNLRNHLAEAGINVLEPPLITGRRFSLVRTSRRATQSAIAAAMGMGSAAVSHFETGKNGLPLHRAILAAGYMKVPLRNLLSRPPAGARAS